MAKPAPFRLNRSAVLLSLISAAFAGEAGAAAGRVDFTTGGVTVAGTDGRERPLAKGAELDNGDTVRTTDGRAQIRFTDGAYVSLQPNSEFSIKDYRYEGKTDGSESGFFGLAKGAMRTVTGLIGRFNRNRYQITTPTATVGIRGTGGVIQVQDDGSTLVVGTSGIWSLTNPAGSIDVPAGVSAVAPSQPNQPPQQSSEAPSAPPTPLPEGNEFSAGDEQTEDGTSQVIQDAVSPPAPAFTPLLSGSGYTAALAYQISGFSPQIDGGEGGAFNEVDAIFNGTGQLTAATDTSNTFNSITLEPGGTHADFGSDGILAWGRWTGPVTFTAFEAGTQTYGPNEGLHYVIGAPTVMLPTDVQATYSLLGATRPTYVGGATVPGQVISGSLLVQFFSQGYDITLQNFGVQMPDATYHLNGGNFIQFTGSQFSINPDVTKNGQACGGSGCFAGVNGFFAGANAERAGISYHIGDFSGATKDVLGAAAFQQTSTSPLQQQLLLGE